MVSRLSIGGCCCGETSYLGFAVFPTWFEQSVADFVGISGKSEHDARAALEGYVRDMLCGLLPNSVLYYQWDLADITSRTWRKLRHAQTQSWTDPKRLNGVIVGGMPYFQKFVTGPDSGGPFGWHGLEDWWHSYGFFLPSPGSVELTALQAYLASGGTVILDLPAVGWYVSDQPRTQLLIDRLNQFFADIGSACRVAQHFDTDLWLHRVVYPNLHDDQRTTFAHREPAFEAAANAAHGGGTINSSFDIHGQFAYSVGANAAPDSADPAFLEYGSGPVGTYAGRVYALSSDAFITGGANSGQHPLHLSAPDSIVEHFETAARCDFPYPTAPPNSHYNDHRVLDRVFLESRRNTATAGYDETFETGPRRRVPVSVHERLPGGGWLLCTNPRSGSVPNSRLNWSLSLLSADRRMMRPGWMTSPAVPTPSGATGDEGADGIAGRTATDGAHVFSGSRFANGIRFCRPWQATAAWSNTINRRASFLLEYDGAFAVGPHQYSAADSFTPNAWNQHHASTFYWETPERPADSPDQHPGIRITYRPSVVADPSWSGPFPTLLYDQIGNQHGLAGTYTVSAYRSNQPLETGFVPVTDDRDAWLSYYETRVAPFVSFGILTDSQMATVANWIGTPGEPASSAVQAALRAAIEINQDQFGRTDSPANYETEWLAIFGRPRFGRRTAAASLTYSSPAVVSVIAQAGKIFTNDSHIQRDQYFAAERTGGTGFGDDLPVYGAFARLDGFAAADGSALLYSMTAGLPFLPLVQWETGPLEWGTEYQVTVNTFGHDFIRRTPPSRFAEIYGALPTL